MSKMNATDAGSGPERDLRFGRFRRPEKKAEASSAIVEKAMRR